MRKPERPCFKDLNRVFAQWSASSDNQSEPGEIRYLLFVNDDPNPTEVVMGITRTVAYGNATGDNTFVLKAIDAAGNVSVSNPVTFAVVVLSAISHRPSSAPGRRARRSGARARLPQPWARC